MKKYFCLIFIIFINWNLIGQNDNKMILRPNGEIIKIDKSQDLKEAIRDCLFKK